MHLQHCVLSLSVAVLAAALPKHDIADDGPLYENTTAGYHRIMAHGEVTLHAALAQAYTLQSNYDYRNWFNSFTVEALGTSDPTGGYVNYLSQAAAQSSGLYRIQNNQVYIGVDSTNRLNPSGPGRNSVRIHSNTAYTHGLFILDLAHMPGSVCGSWPAYWLVGPNWPYNGEIDIIEGVNAQTTNLMTLHTGAGCNVVVGEGGQTGMSGETNCNANSAYNGCAVTSNTAGSYGAPFNQAGGGVFATFWNQGSIQVWYWPQRTVPSDIRNGAPVPLGWGTPMAHFAGCNFDDYIRNHQIIFDVTFCGQWAGNVWASGSCRSAADTCVNYVANNPAAFRESYWLINSLKVYTV